MVWPTLGSRTAKEQEQDDINLPAAITLGGADDRGGATPAGHMICCDERLACSSSGGVCYSC